MNWKIPHSVYTKLDCLSCIIIWGADFSKTLFHSSLPMCWWKFSSSFFFFELLLLTFKCHTLRNFHFSHLIFFFTFVMHKCHLCCRLDHQKTSTESLFSSFLSHWNQNNEKLLYVTPGFDNYILAVMRTIK